MNIHEYQAKELLKSNGVNVPNGKVAFTVEEAINVAKELNAGVWVVKAQIHAGGRGKAGGVKLIKRSDVLNESKAMLSKTLITHQTENSAPFIVSSGYYLNYWNKTENGWRISKRVLKTDRFEN